MNNCFSIYHTSWITSGPKSNFICDNIPTKAILFFFCCSQVNSTWLITSELAKQRARKVLFTCVVYTNKNYPLDSLKCNCNRFRKLNFSPGQDYCPQGGELFHEVRAIKNEFYNIKLYYFYSKTMFRVFHQKIYCLEPETSIIY